MKASIDGVSYDIEGMADQQAEEWMSLRVMAWWRQITIYRSLEAQVLGAMSQNLSAPVEEAKAGNLDRDELISQLSSEYVTINNNLVHRALQGKADAEIIRSLKNKEKESIIALQDRENGFDMFQKIAEMEAKTNEARPKIDEILRKNQEQIEADERNRGIRLPVKSPKIAKKISKLIRRDKVKSKK